MDISDAYMAPNIESAGVVLTDAEAEELQNWLEEIISDAISQTADDGEPISQIDARNLIVNIAGLSFQAGRAYEEQFHGQSDTFPVDMSPKLLSAFINYLTEKIDQ